ELHLQSEQLPSAARLDDRTQTFGQFDLQTGCWIDDVGRRRYGFPTRIEPKLRYFPKRVLNAIQPASLRLQGKLDDVQEISLPVAVRVNELHRRQRNPRFGP